MLQQGMRGANMIVMNTRTERDHGRKAQLGNIQAAKAVSDIIRTTLGPRSMLKMILDPMGGIVMTNDGNAILREIDVNHPAAKSMIELSRTQDEEVGDGTTSVIILAGEILQLSEPLLLRNLHPRSIVHGFNLALEDCISLMNPNNEKLEELKKLNLPTLHVDLDINNNKEILKIIQSTIGTKFMSRYGDTVCELALKAVLTVRDEEKIDDNSNEVNVNIDIKRYARIERIPGGQISDSCVLDGVIINKDVLQPGRMRRIIKNPRIVCLDCPLEYGKGESQTNIEITKTTDFEAYLKIEEEYIEKICQNLIKLKPDIVVTEKGCSELAQHFLAKANISVMRRLKKLDNLRLAKVSGATIGYRTELMTTKDVGTLCGKFEVKQLANETFSFFTECKNPKACSVILRGGSKDVLQEMWRNLEDAMAVTKNLLLNPRILPGGGATEMALSTYLLEQSNKRDMDGTVQDAYIAVAKSLEVIPRILIQNCGKQPIKVLTELRKKHNNKNDKNYMNYGVNGLNGNVISMNELQIWEPLVVKMQTIKTAIESSSMLLRIDDVVSGIRNKED